MRTEDGYIIYKCLNGDSSAFGFLVDKYKAGVYAVAYERLHNFHDAEDIAQEVFLKAYRSLRNLRHWDSFASWLYRITLNLCRDWLRIENRRPDRDYAEDQSQEALDAPSGDTYRQELACESVREALDSLPESHRQILTLRYLAGMTSVEIARFAGVSPSAIRMRLSKARSLLKEEILAMMSTTEQKLQSTFTLRIVDAVKRIRIQPTPRTGGFPWGLSLATGIVLAILRFSPYPGIINRAVAGSLLSEETKLLKVGEIPVDVLGFSEMPVLAGGHGDDDSRETESSASHNPTLASADDEGDTWTQGAISDKGAIIDPDTGVKYTRIKSLAGKSDVISKNATQIYRPLSLSPNGKFLLWNKTVIPLDGGEPFDLTDMPEIPWAWCGVWSPDGKMACFEEGGASWYSGGNIWIVPVSPDTGRPTGPAEKLVEGQYRLNPCSWSPDMEKLAAVKSREIWTISVKDGTATQITDRQYADTPVWSPDGKTIAYSFAESGIRLIPAEGGKPVKFFKGDGRSIRTVSWSPDGKWLVCDNRNVFYPKLWLFRLQDGQELEIKPPQEVGKVFSWSPDSGKMLFYRASYDFRVALKVVSREGGPPISLGDKLPLSWGSQWSPDSKMIAKYGWTGDGDWVWWVIPLSGSDPFPIYPLKLDVSVPGYPEPILLSPDGTKLLLSVYVEREKMTMEVWVAPFSLKDGQTTGPTVKVFDRGLPGADWDSRWCAWSPDGTKIALIHDWDLWIAYADGSEPVQLTNTRVDRAEYNPEWSPDGEMIAYELYHSPGEPFLYVISASGGEPRKMLNSHVLSGAGPRWSPDGKELAVITEDKLLLAVPIDGGKPRQIADLSSLAANEYYGLCWSPDGQKLAFRSGKYRIFTVPAEGGELPELVAEDSYQITGLRWSPDGKWISYSSDWQMRTRPEGTIWEADVSELLNRETPDQ